MSMSPEQIQSLNDRVAKLESDKAAEEVILENINNFLKTLQEGVSSLNAKMDKSMLYNEKHDQLSKEFDKLEKEFEEQRRDIDKGFGWIKGSLASAGVLVTIILAMVMFVAKDGLEGIKENSMRVQGIEQQLERVEARINLANPKQP